jgi:hypothetical protein
MITLLILIVAILILVLLMTRNDVCDRWYCRHKRKEHKFNFYKLTWEWGLGKCKIYDCNCPEFLE